MNHQTSSLETCHPPPGALSAFGERLVTLRDGRLGLRGALSLQIREPSAEEAADPAAPVLEFIASNDTVDRYGEIIEPAGWRLENYRRNPVFQNAHQYGDIVFTLGRALVTEIRTLAGRPVLFQRVEFAVEANPMARIAYGLYRGGFLNAVSVGFIPLRWETPEGLGEPKIRRRYLEQELLEVSAVGIPANPEALRLGLQAGGVAPNDARDVFERLRALFAEGRPPSRPAEPICRGNPAGVETDTGALGADANGAQLLRLARALREILGRNQNPA